MASAGSIKKQKGIIVTISKSVTKAVCWFRRDFRIRDNKALKQAAAAQQLACVYILDNAASDLGAASKVWLHHALQSLNSDLESMGQHLVVLKDQTELLRFITSENVDAVYWNRRYDPNGTAIDKTIKESLKQQGITVESFPNHLLFEPWEACKKDKEPYKVFTPFWNALRERLKEQNYQSSTLRKLPPPFSGLTKTPLPNLLPGKLSWHKQIENTWTMSESGAHQLLDEFDPTTYASGRDIPSEPRTSRMSPYLHFGHITPGAILAKLLAKHRWSSCEVFIKELVWRDFAHQILYHFPHTVTETLNPKFRNFPWEPDPDLLRAWQRGFTGYPIVDAGMRQLWQTGWMHNRVRMIVASFLVKHLQQDWKDGAAWFLDTLVDGDVAQNTFNWQWAAGCGADAAPYFRIFNPWLQGKKFDPNGDYIKEWVPELRGWEPQQIHDPEKRPDDSTYPAPIVDHKEARDRALLAYDKVKT